MHFRLIQIATLLMFSLGCCHSRLSGQQATVHLPYNVISDDLGSSFDPHFVGSRDPSVNSLTEAPQLRPELWDRVISDHREFYSAESLTWLGGGLAVGAAIANSSGDREVHRRFQASVRGATSDDWSEALHANKELGNGIYTLPVMATAWAAGSYFDESQAAVTVGRWGERSLRSFLVGAPPMLLAQRVTGASRPGETDHGSQWRPFADENGVSGHSFMSALPFINAAKMTDNPWAKSAFYAGSLIGPLSRVNDEAHYPSQVALGWWFAYLASSAIDHTEKFNSPWQISPLVTPGATGLQFELNY